MTQKNAKQKPTSPPRNKKTDPVSVLIVDDHPAMRSTMFDILEDEGLAPSIASSGREAINLCEQRSYDVVLMDVQMPGLSGIETLRAIREQPPPHPRFLFMSAYSVSELKEEAYRLGSVAFLQKPLDPDEVIHLIRDRNPLTALLHLKDESARKLSAEALEQAGFHVVATASFDEILINARQISYRFVIFENEDETEAEALRQALGQFCPMSQILHAESGAPAEAILEEVSRMRSQSQRRESMLSGW